MESFIFGKGTSVKTPEELARRRALSAAIIARNNQGAPKNIWEGLNSLATSIGERNMEDRYDEAESTGKAGADAAYQPVIDAIKGGKTVGNDALLGLVGNEWANPGQKAVGQALLSQNLEANAPLTNWQKAQLAKDDQLTPYQERYLRYLESQATKSGGEYGLNPVWAQDENGKWHLYQPNKGGGNPAEVNFPNGVTPQPQVNFLDTGTEFVPRATKGGAPVGAATPKDIAGKQAQEEIGTAQGKAAAAAPGDYQAGQNALDLIGDIRNDPNKAWGTGFSSIGNVIPGTPGYDFQNKVDQARSGAFLTAIQQMRGLGALSNAEGSAATAAVNRMSTATSEAEFNAALDAYETIVKQGMDRAAKRGGAPAAAAPDASQNAFASDPQFGQEVNGFKIGQTARNAQGEVITWDGNGWRQ